MNVYSFYRKHSFREVRSVSTHTQQLDLIEMWKDSWSEYGWNPIVLGLDDIEKDDFFLVKIHTFLYLSFEKWSKS